MTLPHRSPDPLILTARLDPVSAAIFQRLRDRHFPARLNLVPAHCTLFHQLPGASVQTIGTMLSAFCGSRPPPAFSSAGLRFLGRGVAIDLRCAELAAVRSDLATVWASHLSPQDRQGFRPHVTVQNKADPAAARALRDHLIATFEPVEGRVDGLDLWHYRAGPWQAAGYFAFRASLGHPA